MPEQHAQLNYLRITPRKVRLVADAIKGLSVNEAEAQLMNLSKRAAKPLLKLLRSAIADAKHNQRLNPDQLYIQGIRVDQGPMLERYLPRARGRATPIQKKTSHITLILRENPNLKPRFKIVVEKKVKLPPGEAKKPKPKKPQIHEKEETAARPQKKAGFFQRVFRRKAVGE